MAKVRAKDATEVSAQLTHPRLPSLLRRGHEPEEVDLGQLELRWYH